MNALRQLCLLMALAALSACGGGGSSSAPAPAPATPPVISNLLFTPNSATVGAGGGMITVAASLNFTDSGGDLANITLNVFDVANVQVDAITKAVTGATGVTAGTINATVQAGTGLAGQYSIQVTAADAAGAKSNTLVSTFLVGSPATFVRTGNLSSSRGSCAMTLLTSGKVLLAGGTTTESIFVGMPSLVSKGELYDPTTGRWTATLGGLLQSRAVPAAALLPSGKVLVAGGTALTNDPLASAELYDPATDAFTAAGSMGTVRAEHALVLLGNGKVLAAGGRNAANVYMNSAELYDPATNTWAPTGSMATARGNFCMTLLGDGRVLVAGGNSNGTGVTNAAELYNPATGTFSPTASMGSARATYMSTALTDGRIMVAGGFSGIPLSSIELYNPTTNTWSGSNAMNAVRYQGAAVRLPDGKILITGGKDTSGSTATAELYDPATGLCTVTGAMSVSRILNGRAVPLATGKVLVTGSGDATSELYFP